MINSSMEGVLDIQATEEKRLAALRATGLLDSAPEHFFDLMTTLAAKALKVPVVLMSLVDSDRQFFKSQCGLPAPWAERRETPLSHSFCQYVSAVGEAFVVEDARAHPLVQENLAVPELGVVAYAGIPLITDEGYTLGSLCAIDTIPRRWTGAELATLKDFSEQMIAEINVRTRLYRLTKERDASRASRDALRVSMRHIVHDLRTPLNALKLGIDGIEVMGPLEAEQQACLEMVRRNANVLRNLVNRLIEIERPGSRKIISRVRCSPHELIDRALEQVAALAEKAGIRLQSQVAPRLPPVRAIPEELTRVLVNLIANGVKFTPRGGEVQAGVSIENVAGGVMVRFVIRDTGIGIAPADQERIFSEGVRVDETADSEQSSGIGLAFCKSVLEQYESQLELESAPAEGSTFAFSLPAETLGGLAQAGTG
ncbi:MAG: GAF domain-containing sensor histidine kinase [Chthoniobacterales bacterium]